MLRSSEAKGAVAFTLYFVHLVFFAGTLSGVIGVAATGKILDWYGGSSMLGGWYHAHALAAIICLGATVIFSGFARGDRCFN